MRRRSDDNAPIFGFTWEELQQAQQRGGQLPRETLTGPAIRPTATPADRALLAEHGSLAALEAAGLYGVADRLRNSGSEEGQA